jgi:LDH2 family malate/lactate/ureidoglycolate dehydrogenase
MGSVDAALLADSLVSADLGGVHSHGVLRVPEYVGRLRRGEVDPTGRPRLVRVSGACLVVDGQNSMGQIGATFAMDAAIDRASQTGIAAAAVRGSNHCGAMAYYVT